jgi:hypothetical protein
VSKFEFRLEQDKNLLTGDDLARIRYRRDGVRRWSSFVVVLDDETTFETVETNAEHLIALYEARS